ncbi:MAG: 50S ribosomal protein L18 [Lentisphaerae bacterium]|nr:50S ribosomal protein L18 [Lentisphaerota bacterium]
MSKKTRKHARDRRHARLRRRLAGTAAVPRLSVCRTGSHIYAQIIDDDRMTTLTAASTLEKDMREQKLRANVAAGAIIGKRIAEKALAINVKNVVFDRGGFLYHGCIKALADAAREAGLVF